MHTSHECEWLCQYLGFAQMMNISTRGNHYPQNNDVKICFCGFLFIYFFIYLFFLNARSPQTRLKATLNKGLQVEKH